VRASIAVSHASFGDQTTLENEVFSMRSHFVLVAAACATLAGCAREPEPAAPGAETQGTSPAPDLPATIVAERGGFIPEGVEYDAKNGRILTGSLSEGTIFHIHADGRVTPAVTDPELRSSVGIEVDEPRNRLLVANSDRSVFQGGGAGQAKLGVYNLTTGERIAMVDLAAAITDAPDKAVYFANDVAVADDGTAYVTDTRMNVIYRVSPDYKASVLHRFQHTKGVALNGIVYHAAGYLLVAGGTTLYKVPLDNPTQTTQVKLPEAVPGQDGMLWTADGRLAIVSNSGNRVVALRSNDDWATAQLAGVAAYSGQATTAAAVGDALYVVHPHFADAEPPSIARVTLQ
jgi:sugar lactone lactonase YvrE